MQNFLILLDQTQQPSPASLLLPLVTLFAMFYWFSIRPQRQKQKELMFVQYGIEVGDYILTSAGMYGKVLDIIDETVVVEFGTNKGVRIPILRSSIVAKEEPNLKIAKEDKTEE